VLRLFSSISMSEGDFPAFIDYLRESQIDYLLLAYLSLPDATISQYEPLVQLRKLCRDSSISIPDLQPNLKKYIDANGIQPIAPKLFLINRQKDAIAEEYCKVRDSWGLHMPFLFQTFDVKHGKMTNMFFVLCAHPQDAVIRMMDYLESGYIIVDSKAWDICGIIEHTLEDSALVRQIFDCETMASYFDKVLNKEELTQLVKQIPTVLSSEFACKGLLQDEDCVVFDSKQRSREVSKKGKQDYKVSYHFLSNIVASKPDHQAAMRVLLGENWSLMENMRDKKKLSGITRAAIDSLSPFQKSLIFIDPAALPGAPNGITTALTRKSTEDPYPVYEGRSEFMLGRLIDETPSKILTPHDHSLSRKDKLWLLCNLSLTIPPFDVHLVAYNQKLRGLEPRASPVIETEFWKGASTGAQAPGTKPGHTETRPLASSSRSGTPAVLPKWFQSALSMASGKSKNPKEIKNERRIAMLPSWARERLMCLMYVSDCYCVKDMASGSLRVHNSNNTYVAVLQNEKTAEDKEDVTLMLSCPSREHRIVENRFPDVIRLVARDPDPVRETDLSQFRGVLWLMIEGEAHFKELLQRLSYGKITITIMLQLQLQFKLQLAFVVLHTHIYRIFTCCVVRPFISHATEVFIARRGAREHRGVLEEAKAGGMQ